MDERVETQGFWSRRRAAVKAEAAELEAAEATLVEVDKNKPDAEILAELNLPDPDTLMPGDDFSGFLQKAVPEHIRRVALRRLWRSNPVLANLDGLLDYDNDFTDAATVVPDLKTSYEVGRGMMRHIMALAEDEAEASDRESNESYEEEDLVEALAVEEDLVAVTEQEVDAPPGEEAFLPLRRHMRFHFDACET